MIDREQYQDSGLNNRRKMTVTTSIRNALIYVQMQPVVFKMHANVPLSSGPVEAKNHVSMHRVRKQLASVGREYMAQMHVNQVRKLCPFTSWSTLLIE